MGGSQYAYTVFFAGNGAFQSEMATSGVPGMPGSRGVTRCQGSYQFNGQNLATRVNCVACPAGGACVQASPIQIGGPVQFLDQNTFNIGGDIFRRQ